MSQTLLVKANRVDDPQWDALIRIWREANSAHEKIIEGIVGIARLYLREKDCWRVFLALKGIRRPARGPTSKSAFHGLCKHLIGLGNGWDGSGAASRLAAVLDEWAADPVPPDEIPRWIASRGSISRIYAGVRSSLPSFHGDAQPVEPVEPVETEIRPEFARRVIEHYRPSGKCLDMCRGQIGGFFDALPRADRHFCEISLGRDFFDWKTNCDWIFGNPPWGDVYEDFLRHALSLAPHVVFLSRLDTALNSRKRHDVWRFTHGLHPVIVVRWEDAFVGTRAGWTLGLFHFERGFASDGWVYWD